MAFNAITAMASTIRNEFIADGFNPVTINMGLCADFADALASGLTNEGIDVEITGTDYFWSEDSGVDELAQMRRDQVALPPGLRWDDLDAFDFANCASHTWLEFGGRCFDAELVEGTDNPFDFPCIRHALVEILDEHPERREALAEKHDWWRESIAIRRRREKEMVAATSAISRI